jgi:DNA-binding protein H-NS
MKTYAAIKAEIAKLEEQAERARKAEVAGVINRIKQAIAAYGLTAEDLGFGDSATSDRKSLRRARSTPSSKTGVARYRDPATGKTWTGQGRPPAWIAAAADRDAFLIGAGASNPGTRGTRATRKSTVKDRTPSKPIPTGKRRRTSRKAGAAPAKTAAVQIESGSASE